MDFGENFTGLSAGYGRVGTDLRPLRPADHHEWTRFVTIGVLFHLAKAAIDPGRHRRQGRGLPHGRRQGIPQGPNGKGRDHEDRQKMADHGPDFHAWSIAWFRAGEKTWFLTGAAAFPVWRQPAWPRRAIKDARKYPNPPSP